MKLESLPDSHLSSAQVAEWLLGERNAIAARHLTSCAACRSKIAQFDQALRGFRGSVRKWSDDQIPLRLPTQTFDGNVSHIRKYSWASAALCTVAALALVLFFRHEPFGRPASRQATVQTSVSESDEAALLTQIAQEVSRTVPDAMDSLSTLVAGDDVRATARATSATDGGNR
jgi:hypothetical protein